MYKLFKFWYIIILVSFIFTTIIYFSQKQQQLLFKDSTTTDKRFTNSKNEDRVSNLIQKRWDLEKNKGERSQTEERDTKHLLRDFIGNHWNEQNSSSNDDSDDDDSQEFNESSFEDSEMSSLGNTTSLGTTDPPKNNISSSTSTGDPFDDEYFIEYFSQGNSKALTCFSTLFNYRNNMMMFSSLSNSIANGPGDSCFLGNCSGTPPPTPPSLPPTPPEGDITGFLTPPPPPITTAITTTTTTIPPIETCNVFGCKPSVFPIPTIAPKPMNQQGWQNLNFQIETHYLDPKNDVGRSCRFIGEGIIFGTKSNGECDFDNGLFIDCTYRCTEYDIATPEFRQFITNVLLPTTTEILESMILVPKPNKGNNLKLNQFFWKSNNYKCDGVPIPEEYTTQGLNPGKNLLLYVTSRPIAKLNSIAYTLHCNYNFKVNDNGKYQFGRPLAGTINFSPKYFRKYKFKKENTLNFQKAVQATLHEFIHLLGFDSFFYDSYLDQNGIPHLNPLISKTIKRLNPSGASITKTYSYFNTPRIQWALKNHFNCNQQPNPIGLELEDVADNGVLPSHFSSHIFFGELMTTSMNPTMTLSIFTLALLQDMGWYVVDTSYSQEYLYGKNEGCSFLSERCEAWSKSRGYFCESNSFGCSPDKRSYSFCGVKEYQNPLEKQFQHFSNPKLGGPRSHDFCPVLGYNSITRGIFCSQLPKNITHPTSLVESTQLSYNLLLANSETYNNLEYDTENQNLRCFNVKYSINQSSLPSPSSNTSGNVNGGGGGGGLQMANCFHQECDFQRGVLKVLIKEKWFDCPIGGGYVNDNRTLDSKDLQIECPNFDTFCTTLTLPLLVPVGENLENEVTQPKYSWWKSSKFLIPMIGAVGLSLILLGGGIFVYKKYFKSNRIFSFRKNVVQSEMNIINDSTTNSTRSDYSESIQEI